LCQSLNRPLTLARAVLVLGRSSTRGEGGVELTGKSKEPFAAREFGGLSAGRFNRSLPNERDEVL
jgi:hypothetical protein